MDNFNIVPLKTGEGRKNKLFSSSQLCQVNPSVTALNPNDVTEPEPEQESREWPRGTAYI